MKLKSIAAILVAGLMVVSVPMVAMAETVTKLDINESGTYSQIVAGTATGDYAVKLAESNITATMTGYIDVESSNYVESVHASATGASLEIKGTKPGTEDSIVVTTSAGFNVRGISVKQKDCSVTTDGNIVVTTSGASANVYGVDTAESIVHTKNITASITNKDSSQKSAYGVKADKQSTVTAENIDVANAGAWYTWGIYADNNSTVTAEDVSVTGNGTGRTVIGVEAIGGSFITVNNVKSNDLGVWTFPGTVVVKGDVDAKDAIYFNNTSNKGGTVTVLGKVDGDTHNVVVADPSNKAYSLFAYEIETDDGLKFVDKKGVSNDSIKDQVFYIVKTSGVGDIASLTDKNNNQYTTTVDGKTYYGVKSSDAKGTEIRPSAKEISEGNGYIVRVTEVPGYKFKSMTSAKGILTDNGDGTYTLIVPEGGGVTLDLIYEAIKKSGASFTSTPTSMGSASAPITGGTWTNVNGVWTYTNNGEKLINTTAWIQYTNAQGQTVTQKFCFDNNGNMITNAWKQTADGVWNYFGADGAMLVNTTTPDGYVVDANGNWVKAQ